MGGQMNLEADAGHGDSHTPVLNNEIDLVGHLFFRELSFLTCKAYTVVKGQSEPYLFALTLLKH